MPIPEWINAFVTAVGLPAGAIALAIGMVRGAGALEKDASEAALKYISGLLMKGSLVSFGKVGAAYIPMIFDRIFGKNPLSARFIFRSMLATVLFWALLLILKRADWNYVFSDIVTHNIYIVLIPLWYILDWVSLVKARFFLGWMAKGYPLILTFSLCLVDIAISIILSAIFMFFVELGSDFVDGLGFEYLRLDLRYAVRLDALWVFFSIPQKDADLSAVVSLSTLMTSVWTVLIILSIFLTKLLVPVDELRRFAVWWFRDVERKPLTAIAKVSATLVIVSAGIIKILRWV
jgi:hypothetical protein